MVELFANSGDPNQTPRSVASNLREILLKTIIAIHRFGVVQTGVENL